jgi:hypothetical protein
VLHHPLQNKGTTFTEHERAILGLEGLLPSAVSTLAQEARRAYEAISRKRDPLDRYIAMAALQDRNERLCGRSRLTSRKPSCARPAPREWAARFPTMRYPRQSAPP